MRPLLLALLLLAALPAATLAWQEPAISQEHLQSAVEGGSQGRVSRGGVPGRRLQRLSSALVAHSCGFASPNAPHT
jgi:hypothetical protein